MSIERDLLDERVATRDAGLDREAARRRAADGRALRGINERNRARWPSPPLPRRSTSADGRSAGGIVDERFGRR